MKNMDLNNEGLDYVILGTSLTETILGTGLSISGKKVLHIDLTDRYGGVLANFNLRHFVKFVNEWEYQSETNAFVRGACLRDFKTIDNLCLNEELINSESRNFSIDLIPKVIFSKSKSVTYCLESGVSLYLEFQNIVNNYIFLKDSFMKIPFSKSEVFMNTDLSLKDKRNLVKIINHSLHFYDKYGEKDLDEYRDQNSTHTYEKDVYVSEKDDIEFEKYKDSPISEYLNHHKIDANLCYILLYALGNVNESQENPDKIAIEKITTTEFFARISKYLRSIGYYGHTPMLMANYGTSEYVQSLSRVGSIYGAIYILNDKDLSISDPVLNGDEIESIDLSINATPLKPKDGFIIGKEYEHFFNRAGNNEDLFTEDKCYPIVTQRMVVITHIELANADKGPPIFNIPPSTTNSDESEKYELNNKHPIRIIQQGVASSITPSGFFCYHISMVQSFEERHDFSILLKLKEMLFGKKPVEVLGEKRRENKDKIIDLMMYAIERKQAEERRRKRIEKEELDQALEEQRQIEEAIRQSLGDQTESQTHSNEEKKEESKNEQEEDEEIKIDFDEIFNNDVFYSCVYNQYCRRSGPPSDNSLSRNLRNAWVVEDAKFDLDLDEYFVAAENIHKAHLIERGAKPELLKRDNLTREEDLGIVPDDDDEDLIVAQLGSYLIEESKPKEVSSNETHKQEENKVDGDQDKNITSDDVNDLLDDLIESKD